MTMTQYLDFRNLRLSEPLDVSSILHRESLFDCVVEEPGVVVAVSWPVVLMPNI